MKYKHQTTLTLPVELIFEILRAEDEEGIAWPEELMINKVLLDVVGPKGKVRKIDIVKNLSESELLLLEDEILFEEKS